MLETNRKLHNNYKFYKKVIIILAWDFKNMSKSGKTYSEPATSMEPSSLIVKCRQGAVNLVTMPSLTPSGNV